MRGTLIITVIVRILFMILTALLALVIAPVFIGCGWLLGKLFGVGLLAGTAIVLGTAGVLAILIGTVDIAEHIKLLTISIRKAAEGLKMLGEEDEDDDDDGEEDLSWLEPQEPIRAEPRIARNAKCPCGSGRKYKNCCGKNGDSKVLPLSPNSVTDDNDELPF